MKHWGVLSPIFIQHGAIYGSPSSLDIAVLSDKPLSLYDYATLKEAFDESDLPYRVDIVDWAAVTETFQAIIQKNKITIQPKVL
jgi:hypothetical protein